MESRKEIIPFIFNQQKSSEIDKKPQFSQKAESRLMDLIFYNYERKGKDQHRWNENHIDFIYFFHKHLYI